MSNLDQLNADVATLNSKVTSLESAHTATKTDLVNVQAELEALKASPTLSADDQSKIDAIDAQIVSISAGLDAALTPAA